MLMCFQEKTFCIRNSPGDGGNLMSMIKKCPETPIFLLPQLSISIGLWYSTITKRCNIFNSHKYFTIY
jgi:hypothetical protein